MPRTFTTLMRDASITDHRDLSQTLEDLRRRLGRKMFTVEEWNALICSSFHHEMEACRLEREFAESPI